MPNHDFRCPACGWILRDQYRSIAVGGQADPPACFHCDLPMAWLPAIGRMDLLDATREFTAYDGQNQPVLVESIAQMRRLERESEQQARNGEGQPIRFRALHQSRSNMLDNTFGDPTPARPTAEAKRKFGLQGGASPLSGASGEPDIPFGPGVSESNASALKD